MQYIPGWWDSIKGSATGFTNDLLRTINPGAFAQNDFNEMVKKNPLILNQIGGMENDAKEAFAKAFRFKDGNNPIQGMGPNVAMRGALQNESMVNQGMAADPEGVLARATGARTSEDQQVDALKPAIAQNQVAQGAQNLEVGAQNIQQTGQQIQLNNYRLEDAERQSKTINAAVAAYPNLTGKLIPDVAKAMMSGQEVDPLLMNAIRADPGASDLLDQYTKNLEMQMTEGFIRGRITLQAGTRDTNLFAQMVRSGVDDTSREMSLAMQEMQKFQQANDMAFKLLSLGGSTKDVDPTIVEQYKVLQGNLEIARSNYDKYSQAMAKVVGIERQSPESVTGGQPDDETQRAMAAMQRATTDAQRQQIRQIYKQNTGKDLP